MVRSLSRVFLFLLISGTLLGDNPFEVRFPIQQDLTNKQFIILQEKLRQLDIASLIEEMYESCKDRELADLEDFYEACSTSIHRTLIDPKNALVPIKMVCEIGKKGNRCIVSYAPLDGKYPDHIRSMAHELSKMGFDGYFIYHIGGFPNPTGEEIRYVGVPHSFKIFSIVQAYLLGFSQVLWIDPGCYPLKDIGPLFEMIEQEGALIEWSDPSPALEKYIFPQTRELLFECFHVDVVKEKFINSTLIGMDMDTFAAKEFVKRYYQALKIGFPFFSCFPDRFLLTAILNGKVFRRWMRKRCASVVQDLSSKEAKVSEKLDLLRQQGFYFYHVEDYEKKKKPLGVFTR